MAAEDYDGEQARLAGVRSDMDDLTRALPGSRYAIIGFDSQATRQLPLTTDARAVRTWASTVTQEITAYSAGSSVDRPLDALTQMLTAAQERNPANVRLVFFLSDGENTDGSGSDGEGMASFADLAPLVDGGAVLGYGTADGGRMRSYDGTDRTGIGTDAPFITDTDGSDAISRIDETTLRTIADQMGVQYSHRIAPGGVEDLVADVDLQEIASDGRRDLTTYTGVYWPLAALLTLLLGWEAWHLVREMPRRRDDSAVQARDRRRAAGDPLAGGSRT
jgi:Ca-activated chloride channel homolog